MSLNSNSQSYIHLLQDVYHQEDHQLSVEQWIDQSMISECLFQQLSNIEQNIEMLELYYDSKNLFLIFFFFFIFIILR